MLHACFTPIASCFDYTSWHFYVFSGTNLLMRCHSANSLFSAILCFRKATQEIFSEFDETNPEPPISPGHETKTEGEPEGGQGPTTPGGGVPLAAPGGGVGPLATLWHRLSAYLKHSEAETLNQSAFSPQKFRSTAAIEDQFWGTEVSVPAPCQDGEVPPEPSPSTPPPSPSTSPPSPSTLLSSMMRRE
jgi:hypothetical protein